MATVGDISARGEKQDKAQPQGVSLDPSRREMETRRGGGNA